MDKNELYQELFNDIHTAQLKMLEYNKKNHLPSIRKDSRTIREAEDVIINKFGGKKLDTAYFYEHLTDFFGPKSMMDYIKLLSPCKIIFHHTEEIIPDEYFHSFYWIPLKDELKHSNDYYKELLVYMTSIDGEHIYISGILTDVIDSVEFDKELRRNIAYYEEGIAVFFEDIKDDF